MEIFKIKLENYNDDVPALEFGRFSDNQIRLMIALVEAQLREVGDDIDNINYEIQDVKYGIKMNSKYVLKGRPYKGQAMLEVISNPDIVKDKQRLKRLEQTKLNFCHNKQQIETLYNKFKELGDYLYSLNPDADECYYSDCGFMKNRGFS